MKLADGLEIETPVVLAPMAGSVGPDLCAAVSNAGGLGVLPVWQLSPDELVQAIATTQALTAKPFGINLNNQFDETGHLSAAIDAGAGTVSFFWGLKPALVRRAKDAGMIVLQTIGTAVEARDALDSGVDAVVAQGWESGGHVWGRVSTMALIPPVVDAIGAGKVIAAGGIGDGRGLAAALALGAAAAWMGTRFLMATESLVPDEARAMFSAATEADTAFGKDSNPEWRDSAIRWIGKQVDWAPEYGPVPRRLAGQSVGMIKHSQPAAEIVREVWAEAQNRLRGLAAAG